MNDKEMPSGKEGFTLGLALLDAVPVLAFGADMLLLSRPLDSKLFLTGAALALCGGLCMVIYKLILSIKGKEYPVFMKLFPVLMGSGWVIMIAGAIIKRRSISFPAIWTAVSSMPAALFFILGAVFFASFIIYWKTGFDGSARSNWIEEILNACAQVCFLTAVLLSV
ncbi:MAG: hypothetical protein K5911_07800 [Eubacteriales bacterium]|nr:hypothetical protein [Eubacteriales bacterium]